MDWNFIFFLGLVVFVSFYPMVIDWYFYQKTKREIIEEYKNKFNGEKYD